MSGTDCAKPTLFERYKSSILFQLLVDAFVSFIVCYIITLIIHIKGVELYPTAQGIYVWGLAMAALLFFNPFSFLHKRRVSKDKVTFTAIAIMCILTAIACVIPMSLNSSYNGENPAHRNQYEELADALLEGHLNVHADEDVSALADLVNPYDPYIRAENNVTYKWDHAFYNGKYYVYFGVVPAIVLFVPYKLITGQSLDSFKATAVFAVFIILAIFLIGYKLATKVKSNIPPGVFLPVSSALCAIILWYAIKRPALYCTAITGGICFALWSIFFLMDAFYFKKKPPIWEVVVGFLCGALVFGCRPPIGLSLIVLIPFFVCHIRESVKGRDFRHLAKTVVAAAIPVVTVGVLLMLYNWARFENPFEFGQSYQLTVTDQSVYSGNILQRFSFSYCIRWLGDYFLQWPGLNDIFPYISESTGLFILFPLLVLSILPFRGAPLRLKISHVLSVFVVFVIVAIQTLNSPYILTRYSMDFVFVACLSVLFFCIFAYIPRSADCKTTAISRRWPMTNLLTIIIVALSALAIFMAVVLFFVSGDLALADVDPLFTGKLRDFFFLKNLTEW